MPLSIRRETDRCRSRISVRRKEAIFVALERIRFRDSVVRELRVYGGIPNW